MDADGGILPPPLVEAGGTATSTLRGEGLEEVGGQTCCGDWRRAFWLWLT